MRVYYDRDADLALIKARRSLSSAMAARAMPIPESQGFGRPPDRHRASRKVASAAKASEPASR